MSKAQIIVSTCFLSLNHLKIAVITSISRKKITAANLGKSCSSLDQKNKILVDVKKNKKKGELQRNCRRI